MVVEHPAVHADDRRFVADRGAREDSEVDTARANRLTIEMRRPREGSPERNEGSVRQGFAGGGRQKNSISVW